MISDGLQMSHSSTTDKNAQSGVDTLSSGEFLSSIFFLLIWYSLSCVYFLKCTVTILCLFLPLNDLSAIHEF